MTSTMKAAEPIEEQAHGRESFLKVARDWKSFWMNQKQNDEADFQNYFNRALGVDANMTHHIADKMFAHHSEAVQHLRDENAELRELLSHCRSYVNMNTMPSIGDRIDNLLQSETQRGGL